MPCTLRAHLRQCVRAKLNLVLLAVGDGEQGERAEDVAIRPRHRLREQRLELLHGGALACALSPCSTITQPCCGTLPSFFTIAAATASADLPPSSRRSRWWAPQRRWLAKRPYRLRAARQQRASPSSASRANMSAVSAAENVSNIASPPNALMMALVVVDPTPREWPCSRRPCRFELRVRRGWPTSETRLFTAAVAKAKFWLFRLPSLVVHFASQLTHQVDLLAR